MKKIKTRSLILRESYNLLKERKGITLIALVITIIVLLILVAVSIVTLTGENGILVNATKAKQQAEEEKVKENIKLAYNVSQIETYENNDIKVTDRIKKELENMYGIGKIEVNVNTVKKQIIVEIEGVGTYIIDENTFTIYRSDKEIEQFFYASSLTQFIQKNSLTIDISDLLNQSEISAIILNNEKIKKKYNLTGDIDEDKQILLSSDSKAEDLLKIINGEPITLIQMLESKKFADKINKSAEAVVKDLSESYGIIQEIKDLGKKGIIGQNIPYLRRFLEDKNENYEYLFFFGDEGSDTTKQWGINPLIGEAEHGACEKKADHLLISGYYCYGYNFTVTQESPFDLTNYSSIHAKVEVVGLSGNHNNRNTGMKILTKAGNTLKSQLIRESGIDNLEKGIEEISIDLTGLTETETYIAFDSNSYMLKIYEVWLEK